MCWHLWCWDAPYTYVLWDTLIGIFSPSSLLYKTVIKIINDIKGQIKFSNITTLNHIRYIQNFYKLNVKLVGCWTSYPPPTSFCLCVHPGSCQFSACVFPFSTLNPTVGSYLFIALSNDLNQKVIIDLIWWLFRSEQFHSA